MSDQPPAPLNYASASPVRPPPSARACPPHPVRLIACAILALAGAVLAVAGVVAEGIVAEHGNWIKGSGGGELTTRWGNPLIVIGVIIVAVGVAAFVTDFLRGWSAADR